MEKVYITMIGAARLFSSKEKLNWLTGGLGQKKEAILESGFDAEIPHSREGYECYNCKTFVIGTKEESDSNNKIKRKAEYSTDRAHYHSSNFPQK